MIIAVTGWRDYADAGFIHQHLTPWLSLCRNAGRVLHIRVGDAKGADEITWRWCLDQNVSHRVFYADWDKYGKMAGPIRNEQMLRGIGDPFLGQTNMLMGFPPNNGARITVPGSGTWGCIIKAYELGIKVEIPAYRKQ